MPAEIADAGQITDLATDRNLVVVEWGDGCLGKVDLNDLTPTAKTFGVPPADPQMSETMRVSSVGDGRLLLSATQYGLKGRFSAYNLASGTRLFSIEATPNHLRDILGLDETGSHIYCSTSNNAIARLSSETGAQDWVSSVPEDQGLFFFKVSSGEDLLVAANHSIVACYGRDGHRHWKSDALNSHEEVLVPDQPVRGDTVFYYDGSKNRIVALDIASGATKWALHVDGFDAIRAISRDGDQLVIERAGKIATYFPNTMTFVDLQIDRDEDFRFAEAGNVIALPGLMTLSSDATKNIEKVGRTSNLLKILDVHTGKVLRSVELRRGK
jgi:outer membrane protein assembly factor BamB